MKKKLKISHEALSYRQAADFTFNREDYSSLEIGSDCMEKVKKSHTHFLDLLGKKIPIYGVTTGFGDSCFRVIQKEQSETLQKNLISYLLCGTGPILSREASRAIFLLRLKSLSRGYSGVSPELLDRMRLFLEHDWIPLIPQEGSLGASGDLIPLAYLGEALQGDGWLHDSQKGKVSTRDTLKAAGIPEYRLKPKEGLALVNGTSSMTGLYLVNLNAAYFLLDLACLTTSWLCLTLRGRTEAFGTLVNEKAKTHPGQSQIAQTVLRLLNAESYEPKPLQQVNIKAFQTEELIQDRYSLRCSPQILGPIADTLEMLKTWLESEINSTSDNPLVDEQGNLAMGGNFYGGHLSQGMDYLKISLAHLADMLDRQLMLLIDEKSNRGLPPNLADWHSIPAEERFLHHGLKGLHQAVSAITSEVMAKSIPNGIFSRSSESHNQDKVSLGMSAAVQCAQMIEPLFTIQSMYLICLAQAFDLRKIQLKGKTSITFYQMIREIVPFVSRDSALGEPIQALSERLKKLAYKQGGIFNGTQKV